ncbi:myelomonocytic growth factor-like [Spea bombifrons]|uniref:myelomonocytic growth factor-like n=1 Tax=Spea bombifrons TaxID=233779 RepID=UPI00234B6D2B|nr:myelomonocytic growth factor-like [Spea bombifrons]
MCGFHSLCNEDELRIIQRQLGLRSTPLDRCQGVNFDREECFGQLSRGLKDFLILISSARPILHEKLDRLDVDVRDLLTNVQEEMDSQAISVPYLPQETPQYQTHFQRKAGAFLIISDITDFMLMAQNAFRYPFGG